MRSTRRLRREPSVGSIVDAFRWTHLIFWSHAVDVSDLVPDPDFYGIPAYKTPAKAADILRVLAGGEDIVEINFDRLGTEPAAIAEEHRAFMQVLDRLVLYFMTGTATPMASRLWVARSDDRAGKHSAEEAGVLTLGATGQVSLAVNGKTYSRFSPLVYRLGLMISAGQPAAARTLSTVQA